MKEHMKKIIDEAQQHHNNFFNNLKCNHKLKNKIALSVENYGEISISFHKYFTLSFSYNPLGKEWTVDVNPTKILKHGKTHMHFFEEELFEFIEDILSNKYFIYERTGIIGSFFDIIRFRDNTRLDRYIRRSKYKLFVRIYNAERVFVDKNIISNLEI